MVYRPFLFFDGIVDKLLELLPEAIEGRDILDW
jgi:hypothetical protein